MTTKYTKYLRLREWDGMVNRFWYTLDEETDMIGPGVKDWGCNWIQEGELGPTYCIPERSYPEWNYS